MHMLRSLILRTRVCRVIVLLLVCSGISGGGLVAQNAGIPHFIGNKLTGGGIAAGATVDAYSASLGENAATLKDVVSLSISEENAPYLPDNFTASVTIDVAYGDNASATTTLPGIVLTVNYSKDAGVSYDTKKYISLSGARYIKATVTGTPSITPATLSNGVDVLSLLVLKSEIQATLYFTLNPGLVPSNLSSPTDACSGGSIADELPVTWSWPPGAVNNGTQLEWTFVPGDVTTNYYNADGSPNYALLFKNNSTRVDLALGVATYAIPLFYDGPGTVYYRIRAVNYLSSGSRADGPWTYGAPVIFCGHNNALNWQASTSYAEEGKRKTVMQYFDGSLRMRQVVTKDNTTNTTLAGETFYDGQGRPAIQILPAPGINNVVQYQQDLNLFNGQAAGTDPAVQFDLQPVSGGNSSTPALQANGFDVNGNPAYGAARYYSSNNSEIGQNGNGSLPDAGGYPYSVTRYTPDATGRVMSQSGVGPALKMGSGHEAKYFYGNAPQEQLDGLFGTEVGISTHYFKNMVQDANGQMSISYVDMHGRTIATSLAGSASGSLQALDLTQYPGQQPSTLTQNLLPTGSNVVKGNSIESLNSLLVPVGEDYNFSYSLTPDALTLQNCQGTQNICYDCMYDLEVTITDESGDTDPVVRKFSNVSLASGNNCPPSVPLLAAGGGGATSTIAGNLINFTQHLNAGSYSVRKTLTVSDQARESLRDQYVATALCKDEQGIIDSIYNVLASQTQCALPKPPCTNCGQHSLDIIQQEMLADMMPFSGQYAQDPTSVPSSTSSTSSYMAYDIFHTLRYQSPSGGPYQDASGQPDPNASGLSGMTPAAFDNVFAPSWAQQLLPYHPEYQELLFAQQHLGASYEFIDGFNNQQSYQSNYNDPETQDPFFTQVDPGQASYVHNFSAVGGYYNNLSLWQIAYGSVMCTSNPDPQAVDACYNNAPHNPQGWSTLTSDQQDQIWNVYKGLYTNIRDSLVAVYLHDNGQGPNGGQLVRDGYTLRFPVGTAQVPVPPDFPGYPAHAGDAPNVSLTTLASTAQATQISSYVDRWKESLLQCPALASRSDVDDILNTITSRMVAVCQRGQDASNPLGASSVAPANVVAGGDNSFEDVINSVFAAKGISISQLCNPFVIDFPKPYGKNPLENKEWMSVVDKCACDRFAALKAEAGVSTFNELNAYLLTKYGDVLTQMEFDAMQNCNIIGTSPCHSVPVPCDTTGGGAAFAGFAKAQPLSSLPDSGCTVQLCPVITSYPLSSPQPKPAFLDCGFSGYNHCITCSQLSAYISEFKLIFQGQDCAAAPVLGSTDLSADQIGFNVLFAQFVNYRSGLQLDWMTYLTAASAADCDLTQANANANQTVICGDTKPLSDASDLLETEDPCQKTHQMAIAMGHDIYEKRVQQSEDNFDAWYLAKCLSTTETFAVTYLSREYHYTLYYYDQAGNLTRTVAPAGVRPDFSTAFINSVEAQRNSWGVIEPAHVMPTDYRYNSLNVVVSQTSPDAGTSNFWYDNLGRLVVSQNAQQNVDKKFSYTIYDALSRVVEVGQKPQTQAMNQTVSQSPSALTSWIVSNGGTREQVTSTAYDQRAPWMSTDLITGINLRNRVSYTTSQNLITDAQWNATLYSYDVHGNVDTVLQDYDAVQGIAGDHYKRITYDYDLVSNKVNGVDYQNGLGMDAFYHRYRYDAENRVVQVLTSRDSIFWEQEAAYDYYKHGPLARTVLGQLQTQALQYSYTLQGWLKGVNSGGLFNYVPPAGGVGDGSGCSPGTYPDVLTETSRPDSAGPPTYTARSEINFGSGFFVAQGDEMAALVDPNAPACVALPAASGGIVPTDPVSFPIAQNAFNFSLHYYPGDYTPISATTPVTGILEAIPAQAGPLYNGNIAAMAVNLPLASDGSKVYNYHYDQLNRLVAMDAFNGLNTVNHTFTPIQLSDYMERVTYDPNGNILTYNRNGNQTANEAMDLLHYTYTAGTNQLSTLVDNASDGSYTDDIKAPLPGIQYGYDKIGNLTNDGSNSLTWTVYGKIATQTGNSGLMSYQYDAGNNRITKTSNSGTTLYVRDAQGNVLCTYQQGAGGGVFAQQEIDLYGSGRLGMTKAPATPSAISLGSGKFAYVSVFTRGLKTYELANHLGNVLATITDKKIGVPSGGGSSLIDHYTADVATVQDYYPFGMIMPGRSLTAAGSGNYRYGFNGKENDNEVKGVGDQIDYGMRVYDPRVGRFMSVDPITKQYPELTPYQYASNRPIDGIDQDGLEYEGSNASTALAIGNLFMPKTRQLTDQQLKEQGAAYDKAQRMGTVIGVGLSLDIYTGGRVTQFLMAQQLISAFPHNKASTKEGKALQDQNSREALSDAFITWGIGKLAGEGVGLFGKVVKFIPSKLGKMSDAHWAATIKATTRFGEGDIKTIAKGNVNIPKDLQDIFAGQANLENGQIVAPSGRTYGYHSETGNVYLTGGPGTVKLTQAEFSVYVKMQASGGLKDNALKFFNGLKSAKNGGLSDGSQQRLQDLYNSVNYKK